MVYVLKRGISFRTRWKSEEQYYSICYITPKKSNRSEAELEIPPKAVSKVKSLKPRRE
jgi:hypothetical protein